MSNPTSPGWYDDPQDPALLRYFDGIVWTRHTTPRADIAAPPSSDQSGSGPATGTAPPTAPVQGRPAAGDPPLNPYGVPTQGSAAGRPSPPSAPQQGQPPSHQQPLYQQPPGYQQPMPLRGPTTPDGVPLASYGQRVAAWFLDGIIKLLISLLLGGWAIYLSIEPQLENVIHAAERGETVPFSIAYSDANLHWMAVYLVISGVVGLVYSMAFLTRRAATPGKSAVGISVRRLAHPGPVDARTAAVRYLIPFANAVLGVVPFVSTVLSILWAMDHLYPLWQPRRQALHDLMAGTVVVRGPQPRR